MKPLALTLRRLRLHFSGYTGQLMIPPKRYEVQNFFYRHAEAAATRKVSAVVWQTGHTVVRSP